MLVERPQNHMKTEKEREEQARANSDGPRPISAIGGGRGGSLMAFSQGTSYASGGR
jgi:hypothetical protein